MSVALDARLVGFARALRGHGVVVGTSEVVDAGTVAHVLGLDDRDRLREGLASALLRRAGQRQVFDDLTCGFERAVDRINRIAGRSQS